VLKGESVDSMSEGSEEEESTKPTKRPWGFPKAHSMQAHVWATTLLYGDMDNVSALETRSSDPIHHLHTHTNICITLGVRVASECCSRATPFRLVYTRGRKHHVAGRTKLR